MKKAIEWAIFLMVLVGVWVVAGPSSLGGPASYVMVDGRSMEPTYQHGDLVVAYERDVYELGDVIVYDAPVDSQFNVIHRITERTEGGFVTQGDNRDEVDGWIAPDDQIYGSALFHIPSGGAIVTFLRQPAAILALFAGWLTFAYLDRRGRKEVPDEGAKAGATAGHAWSSTIKPSEAPRRRRRRTASPSTDTHNERSWMPRSERRASKRAKRQEQRTTAALLGLAVLVGGSGGVFMAHAAYLNVNAGTLQTFSEAVDLQPPPVETHDISLETRFFSSGQHGGELGTSPFTFQPVEVLADQTYRVAWNGQGNSDPVDCWSDAIDFPDSPTSDDASGVGHFVPDSDATHVLCVGTAPGNVPENIDFFLVDADGDVEIELTPVSESDDISSQTTQAPSGSQSSTPVEEDREDDPSTETPDEEPSDRDDPDQGVNEPRNDEDEANDPDIGSATAPGEDDLSDDADESSTPADGDERAEGDGSEEGDEPKHIDPEDEDETTGTDGSTEEPGGAGSADEDAPDGTG